MSIDRSRVIAHLKEQIEHATRALEFHRDSRPNLAAHMRQIREELIRDYHAEREHLQNLIYRARS